MPSAFRDSKGWIADFRPVRGNGARRRVRVPANRLGHGDPAQAAREFAAECERYCRLIDRDPTDSRAVQHAAQIGAITQEDAESLLQTALPRSNTSILSLIEAAEMHPATVHECTANEREYTRHRRELEEFIAWSGINRVDQLTLPIVQRWVSHLRKQGYSFYGRRHRLVMLRRAVRIGGTQGYPDTLTGWILDHQDNPSPVEVWSLVELGQAIRGLIERQWSRELVATGLGAFMGLRSSEIIRLQVGDLEGDLLHVGTRDAKNLPSRRVLPVPETLLGWAMVLCGEEPLRPLVAPLTGQRKSKATPFAMPDFAHWLAPTLATLTGRALPPKCLRKSFASWTVADNLPVRHVEAFLGHVSGLVAPVTARHYLAKTMAEELRPSAKLIDQVLHRLSTLSLSPTD